MDHANNLNPFFVRMHTARSGVILFFGFREVSGFLKDINLSFYCWVADLSRTEEVHMQRTGESVIALNGRTENIVYLWQPPQFYGLQECY